MIQKLPSLVNNTDELFGKPGQDRLSIGNLHPVEGEVMITSAGEGSRLSGDQS